MERYLGCSCCVEKTGKPPTGICVADGCGKFALMCNSVDCDCRERHKGHEVQQVTSLKEKLEQDARDMTSYLRTCSAVECLIEASQFEYGETLADMKKHHELATNILAGSLKKQITGSDVSKMLKSVMRAKKAEEQLRDTTQLYICNEGALTQQSRE